MFAETLLQMSFQNFSLLLKQFRDGCVYLYLIFELSHSVCMELHCGRKCTCVVCVYSFLITQSGEFGVVSFKHVRSYLTNLMLFEETSKRKLKLQQFKLINREFRHFMKITSIPLTEV